MSRKWQESEISLGFPCLGSFGDDITFEAKAKVRLRGPIDKNGKLRPKRAEILESEVVLASVAERERERLERLGET